MSGTEQIHVQGGTEGKVSQRHRVPVRKRAVCAGLLAALLFVCAVCGAGSMLPAGVRDALPEGVREVLSPVTVQAAGNNPAMTQGAEVLKATANTNSAQTVYYAGNPWRVIAYGTEGNIAGEAGALTLFSADCLTTSRFNPDNGGDCNNYGGSELKTAVDNLFNGSSAIFDSKERAAVLQRTLEVGEYTGSRPYSTGVSGSATSGHLWPLSTAEALDLPGDTFRAANNYWWLRSPGDDDFDAAAVGSDGFVGYDGRNVPFDRGVRPAFYLNLNFVLFTSAAAGGKYCSAEGTANALTSVGKNSGNEWKLTLKDTSYQPYFSVKNNGTKNVNAGENISLDYSDAGTNPNDYVSAIIMDGTNILYYGRFANATDADTNAVLTIPSGLATGNYTLKVFAEQYNGDKKTDYANKVFDFSITVTALPGSVPSSTSGVSESCATGHATYHWITVRAADEHNDGEMVYRCSSCGHERYRVPISGYSIFSKNTMQKILDAPQGATISVSTRRWISFHRMVYQALADRPDVTLKVSFLDGGYRGNRYSVTIPAGYDTLSLLNGTDYCGFLYLGSKFGLSPGE